MFKGLIGGDHPEFKTGAQQDALEYMNFLFEKIERAEKAAGKQTPTKIFDFKLETRIQCAGCKGVRYSESKANQITLLIPEVSKLLEENVKEFPFEACLQNFLAEEMVEYKCPKCQKESVFSK